VKFESEAELQNHVQTVHREQGGDSNSGPLRTPQVSPMPRASPSQTEEVRELNTMEMNTMSTVSRTEIKPSPRL
jgi:hypothetical protein